MQHQPHHVTNTTNQRYRRCANARLKDHIVADLFVMLCSLDWWINLRRSRYLPKGTRTRPLHLSQRFYVHARVSESFAVTSSAL